jgi:hypothetical protein
MRLTFYYVIISEQLFCCHTWWHEVQDGAKRGKRNDFVRFVTVILDRDMDKVHNS